MAKKIHLDTDIGGDMDDVCALAMLLKWPDLDITGVTTVAEERGRRAGYTRYVLDLMGRTDIPVAAGADTADGYFRYNQLGYPPDKENWPEPVPPLPGPLDDALALLKRSVEAGATIVGIGPFTNFLLLEERYPGILKDADLYLMGGYVDVIPPGFPQWKHEDDWNIQMDVRASRHLLEHAHPTLVPVTLTCQTAFRRADLPCLARAGRLGDLLLRQAECFTRHEKLDEKYGATCAGLPADLINFHHDPLACAIALGWDDGVAIETVPLRLETRDSYLYELRDANGIPIRLVMAANTSAFNTFWLHVICG
jgi:inosine-uridine nucleoside N-ribohydrolase